MFNFRLFVVNQRAGVVFCFDLFFRQRGRFCLWRHESLGRDGHWLADFGHGKILQLLNQVNFARCEQVDDGGTELKAAHFLTFQQRYRPFAFAFRPGPALDDAFTRWSNGASPCGFNAADDSRADQNLHHRTKFGIKQTDYAFVAGKQVRYVLRSQDVYREEIARHIHHFTQDTVTRHVYTVVIAWRQVSGYKRTVAEFVRHLIVASQQRFKGIAVPFSLQQFVFFDVA